MSGRLMALSWLSVFVVAGLIGHLTAHKLHAEPIQGPAICPPVGNSNCPTCAQITIPFFGVWDCHLPAQSFASCEPASPPNQCTNTGKYYCDGVVNTMADCSGMDDPKTTCGLPPFESCP